MIFRRLLDWLKGLGPIQPEPVPPEPTPEPIPPGEATEADPTGFLPLFNRIRLRYNLTPVVADAGLIAWAVRNDQAQQARGIGHHVMPPPPCRQNVAEGHDDAAAVLNGWMNSAGHRANLLAPEIRRAGVHKLGAYWTGNFA